MLRVVTGPPAAGKTSYVRDNAAPGDVVIDLDALAVALGSPDPHDHPPAVAAAAHAARAAAIERTRTSKADVWLIHSVPEQADLDAYEKRGADIIEVDPGEDVVRSRIASERPESAQAVADRWYSRPIPLGAEALRTARYWATSGAQQWADASDPETALREKLSTVIDEDDLDLMTAAVMQLAEGRDY